MILDLDSIVKRGPDLATDLLERLSRPLFAAGCWPVRIDTGVLNLLFSDGSDEAALFLGDVAAPVSVAIQTKR